MITSFRQISEIISDDWFQPVLIGWFLPYYIGNNLSECLGLEFDQTVRKL